MKEDVEKSIPLKEETIVWVELTIEQRAFYRAIYENNISKLLKGSTANNMQNLRNVVS
jgi:chromodomain-helicase-DNA-binding protein 7